MKQFTYGLEKVLRYRKYLAKKAQKRLRDTMYECQLIENSIKEIEKKQTMLSEKCSKEKQRGIDVLRYQRYILYSTKLDDDQEKERQAMKETEAAVKLHRTLLEKELVMKKQLERLKEIQIGRYRKYAEKDEQKQSDEIVIIRRKREAL